MIELVIGIALAGLVLSGPFWAPIVGTGLGSDRIPGPVVREARARSKRKRRAFLRRIVMGRRP